MKYMIYNIHLLRHLTISSAHHLIFIHHVRQIYFFIPLFCVPKPERERERERLHLGLLLPRPSILERPFLLFVPQKRNPTMKLPQTGVIRHGRRGGGIQPPNHEDTSTYFLHCLFQITLGPNECLPPPPPSLFDEKIRGLL